MARTDFTLRNSELVMSAEVTTATADNFFLCNDLVEKNKYIYFKRGPIGTTNYECGNERIRMNKNGLTWFQDGSVCQNGLAIWRVEFSDII